MLLKIKNTWNCKTLKKIERYLKSKILEIVKGGSQLNAIENQKYMEL